MVSVAGVATVPGVTLVARSVVVARVVFVSRGTVADVEGPVVAVGAGGVVLRGARMGAMRGGGGMGVLHAGISAGVTG